MTRVINHTGNSLKSTLCCKYTCQILDHNERHDQLSSLHELLKSNFNITSFSAQWLQWWPQSGSHCFWDLWCPHPWWRVSPLMNQNHSIMDSRKNQHEQWTALLKCATFCKDIHFNWAITRVLERQRWNTSVTPHGKLDGSWLHLKMFQNSFGLFPKVTTSCNQGNIFQCLNRCQNKDSPSLPCVLLRCHLEAQISLSFCSFLVSRCHVDVLNVICFSFVFPSARNNEFLLIILDKKL